MFVMSNFPPQECMECGVAGRGSWWTEKKTAVQYRLRISRQTAVGSMQFFDITYNYSRRGTGKAVPALRHNSISKRKYY